MKSFRILLVAFVCLAGIGSADYVTSGAESRQGYCAVCQDQHGFMSGWTGPTRNSEVEAQADASAHRAAYPTHTPFVIPF